MILDLLLKRILTIPGLRIARPGEFSERAFLNDKLDLARRGDCRPDRCQLGASRSLGAELVAGRIFRTGKSSCGSTHSPAHLCRSGDRLPG